MHQNRNFTSKQMGDACEMIIAAELTLAGVPAMKMPDNWPGYDVIAQPKDGSEPQRISVKSRTFKSGPGCWVDYDARDHFDWLAVVLLPGEGQSNRRCFIVPKAIADDRLKHPKAKSQDDKYWQLDKIPGLLRDFEDNFRLHPTGSEVIIAAATS